MSNFEFISRYNARDLFLRVFRCIASRFNLTCEHSHCFLSHTFSLAYTHTHVCLSTHYLTNRAQCIRENYLTTSCNYPSRVARCCGCDRSALFVRLCLPHFVFQRRNYRFKSLFTVAVTILHVSKVGYFRPISLRKHTHTRKFSFSNIVMIPLMSRSSFCSYIYTYIYIRTYVLMCIYLEYNKICDTCALAPRGETRVAMIYRDKS